MKDNIAIKFEHVYKNYKLYKKNDNKILSSIFHSKKTKEKHVLKDISFEIFKGESVAIIGKNGIGKSTILKLISGITYPSSGNIIVNGKLSTILELNSGFETEFTGRENIRLKCMLMGLKKDEIKSIEDSIIKFADIGEYIDQPVKIYSTGMRSRLGFAISIHIDSDILILDEVLSVGDYYFKQKCHEKIKEFLKDKKHTLLLVTHSIDLAEIFCKQGIFLNKGTIEYKGNIEDCIKYYLNHNHV